MTMLCRISRRVAAAAAAASLAMGPAAAGTLTPGPSFSHRDWELACDNTGTCRAVGYPPDTGRNGAAVLLTRPAGPHAPVSGRLMVQRYDLEHVPERLRLFVDGEDLGQVAIGGRDDAGLAPAQVDALLRALVKDTAIVAIDEAQGRHLPVSDAGAAAVLLKMDEAQGRLDTPGALVRRGGRSEATVPAARPVPVVRIPALEPTRPGDAAVGEDPALRMALAASAGDHCDLINTEETHDTPVSIERLDDRHLLASTLCWRGAYNEGHGYWVIRDSAPYAPRLVTDSGSGHADGVIHSDHKGRGLGDCWSFASWAWNGSGFVAAGKSTTGMCRLMAPGGAWTLPTLVTELRPATR